MRVDLPRVLWAATGALALLLVLEWVWPAGGASGTAVSRAAVQVQVHAPGLAARDTSAWVNAVLARPVFSISRRPPPVTKGLRGVAVLDQARLAGIMITRYGRRAIFAPQGGGKPLVLAEGAPVNEGTIRFIQPDRVVMASGAVIRLSYDKTKAATTTGFMPFAPGFPNPGFPNPGFPPQNFPNLGLLPAQQPPGEENGQPVPPPPQMLRGNMIPQRRE